MICLTARKLNGFMLLVLYFVVIIGLSLFNCLLWRGSMDFELATVSDPRALIPKTVLCLTLSRLSFNDY